MYLVQVTYWDTTGGARTWVNEHEIHVENQKQLDAEVSVESANLKNKSAGYDMTVISCPGLDFICTLKKPKYARN